MFEIRADRDAGAGLGQQAGDVIAEAAPNFSSELAAIGGYYAARLAATRAGASPRNLVAAVRAIQNEKIVAIRAVLERWSAAARAATKNRQATRATSSRRPLGSHQPS